jgi:hypothetical protein
MVVSTFAMSNITEVRMKRQWRLQRQFQPTTDAERRWDQAYQQILGWNVPSGLSPAPSAWFRPPLEAEVRNEGSNLRSGINQPSNPGTND